MIKKSAAFKHLYPVISSKLKAGYTYEGVIKFLKDNHNLDLSLKTFNGYMYRYRNKVENGSLDDAIYLAPDDEAKNLIVAPVENVVEADVENVVEADNDVSSSILSRQKHKLVSVSTLNDRANMFLEAAEQNRLNKQSKK